MKSVTKDDVVRLENIGAVELVFYKDLAEDVMNDDTDELDSMEIAAWVLIHDHDGFTADSVLLQLNTDYPDGDIQYCVIPAGEINESSMADILMHAGISPEDGKQCWEMIEGYLAEENGTAEKAPYKPHIGMILFCVVMFFGSIGTEIMTINMFFKAWNAKSWPTTEGKITRSELETTVHAKTSYAAKIEYDYTVEGKMYHSSSVRSRGTGTQDKDDAEDVVQRFPVNSSVRVYYNPDAPDQSYLEVGVGIINFIIIISPLIFMVCFGILSYDLIRQRIQFAISKANGTI